MSMEVGCVVGRAATSEPSSPPRLQQPLRPVSESAKSKVCPLYIGATSWPSLHDEERVDAAYNQEFPPVGPGKKTKDGLTLEEIERRRKFAKLVKQMQQEKEAIGVALAKAEKKALALQEQVGQNLKRIEAQEDEIPEELR
eukprot:symbB.v1.2.003736.t1/scaffold191.1/size276526/1